MRVAILVKEFPPDVIGGTETQTLRLATELHRRADYEVTVYTKSYPGEDQLDTEFDLVRVPNWHVSPFVSTLTFVLLAALYLYRDRRSIDLLQCMMIYPSGSVGFLLNRVAGIPYFPWIRGGDYYFAKNNRLKRRLISIVLGDTITLVQAESIASDVRAEFPHAELQILGNGVAIPDQTADGDRIVYVGRLAKQKGLENLIRAVSGVDERLLVVGDGPERDRLERLAEDLGVEGEFVGEVPIESVDRFYRRGKLFALPAVRGEGLPNAVLEAMSFGLPVVASDIAGTPAVVHDGETGYLVPKNDIEALAERIGRLCVEDELRERMGRNAREFVIENHSWEVIIDRLAAVYDRLLRDRASE